MCEMKWLYFMTIKRNILLWLLCKLQLLHDDQICSTVPMCLCSLWKLILLFCCPFEPGKLKVVLSNDISKILFVFCCFSSSFFFKKLKHTTYQGYENILKFLSLLNPSNDITHHKSENKIKISQLWNTVKWRIHSFYSFKMFVLFIRARARAHSSLFLGVNHSITTNNIIIGME